MNVHDGDKFLGFMNALAEYYGKPAMSTVVVTMYFNGLQDYSYSQVEQAASKHMQSGTGQFIPKIADFVRHIEGGQVTADQVIASARLANTPMGILCRIQIGSFDLGAKGDMFYLRQRAEECLQLMPEWKERASAGDYTNHEISMMLKFDIDTEAPFHIGLIGPECSGDLPERVSKIQGSPRHEFLLESPHKDDEEKKEALEPAGNVRDFLDDIMND